MRSGEWVRWSAVGMHHFLGGAHSGFMTGYACDMAPDPVNKRIYFIGCDHNQAQKFMEYEEATNVWTNRGATPFGAPTAHGYDANVFDHVNDRLYHVFGNVVKICNRASNTWADSASKASLGWYNQGQPGAAFFPERGTAGRVMIFQTGNPPNGVVLEWDVATDTWSTLLHGGGVLVRPQHGFSYHNFAVHSPIHRCVFFGGGNGTRMVFKMNAGGTVTACPDCPTGTMIGPSGNDPSLAVVNPANGNLIVMSSATAWCELDGVTNQWTIKTGPCEVLATPPSANGAYGTVAAPLYWLGLIAFVRCSSPSLAQMWIFKP